MSEFYNTSNNEKHMYPTLVINYSGIKPDLIKSNINLQKFAIMGSCSEEEYLTYKNYIKKLDDGEPFILKKKNLDIKVLSPKAYNEYKESIIEHYYKYNIKLIF